MYIEIDEPCDAINFCKASGFYGSSKMFVAILLNVKKHKHCECDFGTSKKKKYSFKMSFSSNDLHESYIRSVERQTFVLIYLKAI